MNFKIKTSIFVIIILLVTQTLAHAIEYPIGFLNVSGGFGKNDLASALALKGAFRYSVEAYIPGLLIEASYTAHLFQNVEDRNEKVNREEENIFKTRIYDHQVGLTGLLQFRPFTESAIIFMGGGGNINFIGCDSTWTEKYWDPEIDDFQELTHDPEKLLSEMVMGYHVMGGIRFLLGKWGSFDVEVNKSFLNTDAIEWKKEWAEKKYGTKKWDSLKVMAGLTIFIF